MQNRKLNSLQALRALAALLVLFVHTFNTKLGRESVFQYGYSNNFGAIGVNIFFVLSGAIMTVTSAWQKNTISASIFLEKRLKRIVPLYWIWSVIGFALIYVFLYQVPHWIVWFRTATIVPILGKNRFGVALLTVAWTLSFEVLFYLIFSLSIAFNRQRSSLVAFLYYPIVGAIGQHNKQA